jgi:phage-related protein (TIGR01555 family)
MHDKTIDYMVHHSRVLEFKGVPLPTYTSIGVTQDAKYWGVSKLQSIYSKLSAYGSIMQNTQNILYEFNSSTLKLNGLSQLFQAGKEDLLIKRVQAIQAATSTLNVRILDKDETFQKDFTSLASLDQLIGVYMLQLCGVSNIPMVRLFGKSPSGFSSGEYDIKNYYDSVEVYQRTRMAPPLRKFLAILGAKYKVSAVIKFTFNSLYQLTEPEKIDISKKEAETEKLKAETAELYINLGIRDAFEIAKENGWEKEFVEVDVEETPPPKAPIGETDDTNRD